MVLVVSDSSVLIHLASIDRIPLLCELFEHLLIPSAVWQEVVQQGGRRPGVQEITDARQSGWLEVASPANRAILQLLQRELDDGEAEAIALALERCADLLLMDESEGRRIAALYGVATTGTLGLLIRAKQTGKLPALKPELDALRHHGHFWIKRSLYTDALRAVGESA